MKTKAQRVSNAALANAALVFWIYNSILFPMVGAPAKNKSKSLGLSAAVRE